jgi:hypothetical protein
MVMRIYTLGGAPEAHPVHARSKTKKSTHPATNVAQAASKPDTKN